MTSHLIAAFSSQMATVDAAVAIAHDIAVALPTVTDEVLRELRNELVRLKPEDAGVCIVIATVVEVIDGYRVGRERTTTLVLRDLNRSLVRELEKQSSTTTELAATLSCDEPRVSRALARLRELDLIDPPVRDPIDRRRIEHHLSPLARQALAALDAKARREPVWRLSMLASMEGHVHEIESEASSKIAAGTPHSFAVPSTPARTSQLPTAERPRERKPSSPPDALIITHHGNEFDD